MPKIWLDEEESDIAKMVTGCGCLVTVIALVLLAGFVMGMRYLFTGNVL